MLRKEHRRADGPLRGKFTSDLELGEAGATVAPSSTTRIILAAADSVIINHDPCRGSSIGRACGSYNSKEINLKVVGSSPTFGYSYITSSSELLFFCFLSIHQSRSILLRSVKVAGARKWLWHRCVAFFLARDAISLPFIHTPFQSTPPTPKQPCGTSTCLHQQYYPSAPRAHPRPTYS